MGDEPLQEYQNLTLEAIELVQVHLTNIASCIFGMFSCKFVTKFPGLSARRELISETPVIDDCKGYQLG